MGGLVSPCPLLYNRTPSPDPWGTAPIHSSESSILQVLGDAGSPPSSRPSAFKEGDRKGAGGGRSTSGQTPRG